MTIDSQTDWNLQTRSQLVEDLYYTCRQDSEILEELLDEYVYLLKDNPDRLDILKEIISERLSKMRRSISLNDNLDAYEKDIKNYTTYDLHVKLSEAN